MFLCVGASVFFFSHSLHMQVSIVLKGDIWSSPRFSGSFIKELCQTLRANIRQSLKSFRSNPLDSLARLPVRPHSSRSSTCTIRAMQFATITLLAVLAAGNRGMHRRARARRTAVRTSGGARRIGEPHTIIRHPIEIDNDHREIINIVEDAARTLVRSYSTRRGAARAAVSRRV